MDSNSNKGLNDQQVQQSRSQYGRNEIPDSKPTTFLQEFLETFRDPMIRILLIIAVIMLGMFVAGYAEIYEPVGTIIAVVIVAIVSAKTGVASDQKYRKLKEKTKKEECKVYRNNSITMVDIAEVVVGDWVLLQAGDRIPADGNLIQGDLKVDNSVLNGEAEECNKTAAEGRVAFPETVTGESFVDPHSLFRGTVLFDGEGIMEVQKVGVQTMMGKMAEEMQEEEPESPLQVKLAKLADQISTFGYIGATVIATCYLFFYILNAGGIQAYLDMGWSRILPNIVEAVSMAVVLIVCAVPEGLPLMISLVLMQNTSKMLDHNVLVRKAVGIETAGSLNILFSDKTGTITKGSLEVVEFFLADGTIVNQKALKKQQRVQEMLQLAIGKNTASMYDGTHRVIGGNATDQALMKFLGEETYEQVSRQEQYEVTVAQGFNSTNKFSQSYLEGMGKTFYKGAPERLLEVADFYLDAQGVRRPLDKQVVNEKIVRMADQAMRVLAFGYSEKTLVKDVIHEDVVVIGLVGIRDDVRPDAKDAIQDVLQAGIQVVMITGDRLETAVAIGKEAGLLGGEDDLALTSAELNQLSDQEVKRLIPKLKVIARALPTDKSRMVRLCQEMNLVVGMTGDGVNDSPALKRANVGFAMGSGTEAAKEAGEIVVLDDNFQSIKDAIWYGRTIYHNILKFCKFQLVINVAAVVVSGIAAFWGLGEPLKVTHLLFVNLVMDGLGSLMLGNEPARQEYMVEKPRNKTDGIVSKEMLIQILVMGCWLTIISFIFLKSPFFIGFFDTREEQYAAYFVLFIWAALWNGFNVREERFGIFHGLHQNPDFLKVFGIIIVVQAMIVNAPLLPWVLFQWVGELFSCVPFSIQGWFSVILLAFTMIPVDFLRKYITLHNSSPIRK